MPERSIRILDDADALAAAAAEAFARRAGEGIRKKGSFAVALAGGSTPRRLYALLAEAEGHGLSDRIDWTKVHCFWGDERHVPPDHPESNYRMARETLLSKVSVPEANVHRIHGEEPDAARAAALYEQALASHFKLQHGALPRFDLVLLGMGADGHTASLFPGTDAVREEARLVAAPWVEKLETHRITLTPPVLNSAAELLFLVSGADKAPALRAVLEGEKRPDELPAQIVRPTRGRLTWLVDRAAAAALRRTA
jgi:6-phosphogluconolactonase